MLKPLNNNLIVEPVAEESKTILIAETAEKERPMQGIIRYVSKSITDLKVNDTILFSKFGPTEIKHEGKTLLILEISDVFAKIEK